MALVTLGSSFQTVITTAVRTILQAKGGIALVSTDAAPAGTDDAHRLLDGESIIVGAGVEVQAMRVQPGVLLHYMAVDAAPE